MVARRSPLEEEMALVARELVAVDEDDRLLLAKLDENARRKHALRRRFGDLLRMQQDENAERQPQISASTSIDAHAYTTYTFQVSGPRATEPSAISACASYGASDPPTVSGDEYGHTFTVAKMPVNCIPGFPSTEHFIPRHLLMHGEMTPKVFPSSTARYYGDTPSFIIGKQSLAQRIVSLLHEDPAGAWTPLEIAKALNETGKVDSIRSTCARLYADRKINRLSHGTYCALAHGPPKEVG